MAGGRAVGGGETNTLHRPGPVGTVAAEAGGSECCSR